MVKHITHITNDVTWSHELPQPGRLCGNNHMLWVSVCYSVVTENIRHMYGDTVAVVASQTKVYSVCVLNVSDDIQVLGNPSTVKPFTSL